MKKIHIKKVKPATSKKESLLSGGRGCTPQEP